MPSSIALGSVNLQMSRKYKLADNDKLYFLKHLRPFGLWELAGLKKIQRLLNVDDLRTNVSIIKVNLPLQNPFVKIKNQVMKHVFQKLLCVIFIFSFSIPYSFSQSKMAYVNMDDVIQIIPEFKAVDSSLKEYQNALSLNYQEMVKEFTEKQDQLSTKDTLNLTKSQLEVKRKGLSDMYNRIQGYQQQAPKMFQDRQKELMAPILKSANELIWKIAKEHGYTYVLLKEALVVYPQADDIFPFCKQKLGIR